MYVCLSVSDDVALWQTAPIETYRDYSFCFQDCRGFVLDVNSNDLSTEGEFSAAGMCNIEKLRLSVTELLLWSPYVIGQTIIFSSCFFLLSFFFFFPRLISAVGDWMFTILRLAANTGRKNRHLGTIAQRCRAISSQIRHVSTIGKN